MANVTSRHKWQ